MNLISPSPLSATPTVPPRDDAYRILREGHIPFAGLAVREGGVEVRIAEAKDRRRVLSKLVPSTEATPSRGGTVGVADSGDGLIRFMPTDSGFAERLHGLVRQSMEDRTTLTQ
jgi:preprotein translocase subunit SecD